MYTGKDKLGVPASEPVRIVLECDGTQIEDGEYFRTLANNTVLLLLRQGERWYPTGVDVIKAGKCKPYFINDVDAVKVGAVQCLNYIITLIKLNVWRKKHAYKNLLSVSCQYSVSIYSKSQNCGINIQKSLKTIQDNARIAQFYWSSFSTHFRNDQKIYEIYNVKAFLRIGWNRKTCYIISEVWEKSAISINYECCNFCVQ